MKLVRQKKQNRLKTKPNKTNNNNKIKTEKKYVKDKILNSTKETQQIRKM